MQTFHYPPRFNYRLLSPAQWHSNHGCIEIEADGNMIHRVKNVDEFYQALGYTQKDALDEKLEPEVFIWHKYRKDHAEKSEACLQARIMAYLNQHSATFRETYGRYYVGWMGSCDSLKINGDADCVHCKLHPSAEKNENSLFRQSSRWSPIKIAEALTPAQARFGVLKEAARVRNGYVQRED
ncbi:MAG: hypothetical protein HOP04_04080 [Methylophilaceae bacterium]|nr:hypothetical protein [Methylophilaceae bacterium]